MQEIGKIAHFQLQVLLGEGEMGATYKAYDTSLNRQVVVRTLAQAISQNPAAVQVFISEMQLAAAINHPHAAQVYFVGIEENVPFVVLELVEGRTLADILDEKMRFPEAMVLTLATEVIEALEAALRMSIFHGDLNPYNILLDSNMRVKVINFGFSRFQLWMSKLAGEVGGVASYVPPERILGQAEDQRSEIYSLGATLFHVLSGRPPFSGKNAAEILGKKTTHEITDLIRIVPDISIPTSQIIARMVSSKPGSRYSDYASLQKDLLAIQKKVVSGKDTSRLPEAEIIPKAKSRKVQSARPQPEAPGFQSERGSPKASPPRKKRRPSLLIPMVLLGMLIFGSIIWKLIRSAPGMKAGTRIEVAFVANAKSSADSTVEDNGESFGRRKSGYSHGWNNASVPVHGHRFGSQKYGPLGKGFLFIPTSPAGVNWEIEVPNDVYEVTVGNKPERFDCMFHTVVEGATALDVIPHIPEVVLEGTAVVAVNDGRLTIQNGNKAHNNLISYVKIQPTQQPKSAPQRIEPTIIEPPDNMALTAPASIMIKAEVPKAEDFKMIEFFSGNEKIGESSAAPYKLQWDGIAIGNHRIIVQATDHSGRTSTSKPVNLRVESPFKIEKPIAKINFQPYDQPTPEGFLKDIGDDFKEHAGGWKYGWRTGRESCYKGPLRSIAVMTSTRSLDQAYDTYVAIGSARNKAVTWEIELPNGKYLLRIAGGCPRAINEPTILRLNVEGKPFIDGVLKPHNYWLENMREVEVKDGLLTMDVLPSPNLSAIAFLEIGQP